jgi:hypothetical protein
MLAIGTREFAIIATTMVEHMGSGQCGNFNVKSLQSNVFILFAEVQQ